MHHPVYTIGNWQSELAIQATVTVQSLCLVYIVHGRPLQIQCYMSQLGTVYCCTPLIPVHMRNSASWSGDGGMRQFLQLTFYAITSSPAHNLASLGVLNYCECEVFVLHYFQPSWWAGGTSFDHFFPTLGLEPVFSGL